MQSGALDYIYQIHSAATDVGFAQQLAVSYFSSSLQSAPQLQMYSISTNSRVLTTLENLENSAIFVILENSGKTRGNLKYTLEIFENQMVCFGDAVLNPQQADM